jgi:hypothetical protein
MHLQLKNGHDYKQSAPESGDRTDSKNNKQSSKESDSQTMNEQDDSQSTQKTVDPSDADAQSNPKHHGAADHDENVGSMY